MGQELRTLRSNFMQLPRPLLDPLSSQEMRYYWLTSLHFSVVHHELDMRVVTPRHGRHARENRYLRLTEPGSFGGLKLFHGGRRGIDERPFVYCLREQDWTDML